MKYKVSISVDEETIVKVRQKLREGQFRNKSQVYQFAIKQLFLKEQTTE